MKYIVLLLLIATAPIEILLSNPQGGTAALGEFTAQTNGKTLLLRTSNRTVINWDDFSIGFGETTEIIQPSLDSAVLNYVTSDTPSSILGNLLSNGTVYLINPNGILIGPSGFVKTGQFIATTLDGGDAKFFENGELQLRGDSDASIVNLGNITANGDIFLVSRKIDNQGTIHSTNGVVGLAAGQDVLLKESGEQRIFIRPTGEGELLSSGSVEALEIEIRSRGNLSSLAINLDGHVRANSVSESGGRIYLKADNGSIGLGSQVDVARDDLSTFEIVAAQGSITIDSPIDLLGPVQLTAGKILTDTTEFLSVNTDIRDDALLTINSGNIGYTTVGDVTVSSDTYESGAIFTIGDSPIVGDTYTNHQFFPTGTATIEAGVTPNLNGVNDGIINVSGFDVDSSNGEIYLNPDPANVLQRVADGSRTISLGGILNSDGNLWLVNSGSTGSGLTSLAVDIVIDASNPGSGVSTTTSSNSFVASASPPTIQAIASVIPAITPIIYREDLSHVNNRIFGNIKLGNSAAQPMQSTILSQQPRQPILSKLSPLQGGNGRILINLER